LSRQDGVFSDKVEAGVLFVDATEFALEGGQCAKREELKSEWDSGATSMMVVRAIEGVK